MLKKIFFLIPFFAALNGININVYGFNVRTDQLAITVLIFLSLAQLTFRGNKKIITKYDWLLFAFFISLLFSSAIYSPDAKYSLLQTINLFSAASIYFLELYFLSDDRDLEIFLRNYFLAGLLISSYGIIIFLISNLGFHIYGVNLQDNLEIAYGVFATMREPNVFGSYCMIYFIICIGIVLTYSYKLPKSYGLIVKLLMISSGIGVFLSFTRGVWVAIFIIIPIVYYSRKIFFVNIKKSTTGRIITFSLIFITLIYLFVQQYVSKYFLGYKILYLLDTTSGSGSYRINLWEEAIKSFSLYPIFGQGTYSFAVLHPITYMKTGGITVAWIGNFLLTFLHDGGIVATFFFLTFIFLTLKNGFRQIYRLRKINEFYTSLLFGICFSIVCMLIAFLFTTAFSYSYSWMLIGLAAVVGRKLLDLDRQH